jgi:hypothetical protein
MGISESNLLNDSPVRSNLVFSLYYFLSLICTVDAHALIPGWAHAHVLDPDLGAKEGELVQSLENVGEGPDHQSYLTPQLYLQYYIYHT